MTVKEFNEYQEQTNRTANMKLHVDEQLNDRMLKMVLAMRISR